jgi:hypothetical protein
MSDISESNYRGTGCGKAARPDLWGSGEVTIRSTRTLYQIANSLHKNKYYCIKLDISRCLRIILNIRL